MTFLEGPTVLQERLDAINAACHLHIHDTGMRGLTSVANIRRGSILFHEQPVLYISKASQKAFMFSTKVAQARRGTGSLLHRARSPIHAPSSSTVSPTGVADLQAHGFTLSPGWTAASALLALRDLQPVTTSPAPFTAERLAAVLSSNGAGAAFADDASDPDVGMTCLLLAFSMLNHSCTPNVTWRSAWSVERNAPVFTVYALRDIFAGEELRISYGPVDRPQAVRKADLQARYGFTCDCSRCSTCWDDTSALLCPACSCAVYRSRSLLCSSCGESWILAEGISSRLEWLPETAHRAQGDAPCTDQAWSLHSDLVWWLDDEPCMRTLSAAIALVHSYDVKLYQLLLSLREEGLEKQCAAHRNGHSVDDTLQSTAVLVALSETCVHHVSPEPAQQMSTPYTWRRPQEHIDGHLALGDAALLHAASLHHNYISFGETAVSTAACAWPTHVQYAQLSHATQLLALAEEQYTLAHRWTADFAKPCRLEKWEAHISSCTAAVASWRSEPFSSSAIRDAVLHWREERSRM